MAIQSLGGTSVIHLTYRPNGLDGEQWLIACMPQVTDFKTSAHQPNYLRSNDTRAVNCKMCMVTSIFKQVQAKER